MAENPFKKIPGGKSDDVPQKKNFVPEPDPSIPVSALVMCPLLTTNALQLRETPRSVLIQDRTAPPVFPELVTAFQPCIKGNCHLYDEKATYKGESMPCLHKRSMLAQLDVSEALMTFIKHQPVKE